jgi:hypothetical protein
MKKLVLFRKIKNLMMKITWRQKYSKKKMRKILLKNVQKILKKKIKSFRERETKIIEIRFINQE